MNDNLSPDWTYWRSFAAVVTHGSLTAAARSLGLSQPTLGRHIEALEHSLAIALFDRQLKGLRPTQAALRIYTEVEKAQSALGQAAMLAAGSSAAPTGTVRITASTVTAHFTLPAILADLRLTHPEIDIEIVPSDSAENLLMRDADIAVRMFRPTQTELITRKIAESSLSACAHQTYLARKGTPKTPADLVQHDLIGFDKSDLLTANAKRLGFDLKRNDFWIRSDSQTLLWQLSAAGCGIGFAQDCIINAHPGMVHLLPMLKIPPLEIWLTTHKELYINRHIRIIYDELAQRLATYYKGSNDAAVSA